jgi:Family of unknown function (DUF5309)
MAVTVLTGTVDDNVILSNRRVIDMDNVIKQLEPDEAPFTTMLTKVSSRPAKSQKVEWLQDQLMPRLTTLNNGGNVTAIATTCIVATGTGSYFRAGDVLRMSNGENVKVSSISTDTLTIVRSIGAVAAAIITDLTDVIKIGNASAEGATLGTIKSTKQVGQYNYCQIQRDPFGFTNTLIESDLYGGKEPEYEAKKKMMEHKRQIENTLFFGQRDLDTSGSTPVGYAGGIVDFVSSNITASAGTLTQSAFETFMRSAFRYGSRNKVLFASPLLVSALSSFPLGKLAPNDSGSGVKDWGVSLSTYRAASGATVQISEKRDWYDFSTTSNQVGGWGVLVDMDDVEMRPLRSTKLLPGRQANDEDSTKQEYLTEYSFQLGNEQNHAILKGVTGY